MSTVPPPYEEDLDIPFLNNNTTDLSNALYPENSPIGAGRRTLYPDGIFYFFSWLGLTIGDYVGVRVGNLNVPAGSMNIQSNSPPFGLSVPASSLVEGDAVPYFGRVVRVGSLQESRSPIRYMLIKLTVPAGHDRRPWEPWHSGLIMWILGLKPGAIIDAFIAAAGVWALVQPYLNIRKNDVITVYADGIAVEHTVSPAEANSSQPIRIFIDEQVLLQMSKSGPVGFVCTVRDVVHNIPEGKYLYSQPQMFLSDLDPNALPFPLFLADGEVVSQVDLDTQSQSKFSVEVSLAFNRVAPKPPHKVHVVVETTDQGGTTALVRLPAVDDRNRRSEEVPLPNSLVSKLAGGRLRVWFELKNNAGVLLGTSSSTLIEVVGTPTVMPRLKLFPYQAGLIPRDVNVTVDIPDYQPYDPDVLEEVIFDNSITGGSLRVSSKQLAGPPLGSRLFTSQTLKVFEGKGLLQAYYQTDDSKNTAASIRQSQRVDVEIGDPVTSLQKMHVPDALGGNLDPAKVPGTDVEMFIPYTNALIGQTAEWSVIGKDSKSSASGTIKVNAAIAGVGLTQLAIPVPLALFKMNDHGSVRISYSIITPGSPPTVLRSEPLDLTVGQLPVLKNLQILEADTVNGTLDPKKLTVGATLRIAYGPVSVGDVVGWMWSGQYDVSQVDGETQVNPTTGFVDVIVPFDVIARALRQDGNNITVAAVLRRGQFSYTFETLNLLLTPLKMLSAPYIDGFENATVLLVEQIPKGAHINVKVWDFMLADQLKWCTCEGTLEDGSAYVKDIAIADKVTPVELQNGVSLLAPDDLNTLKEGSSFTIKFWVSFP